MLGVDFAADQVVWQKYNPYPKIEPFPEEFVFVDRGEGRESFQPQRSHQRRLAAGACCPSPAAISKLNASDLEFTPLICDGRSTAGTIAFSELMHAERGGTQHEVPTKPSTCWRPTSAASSRPIRRWPREEGRQPARPATPAEINVVLVADVDMLSPAFFQLRETGRHSGAWASASTSTTSLSCSTCWTAWPATTDSSAVRSHRPKYRTLTQIEERTQASTLKAAKQRDKFYKECEETD